MWFSNCGEWLRSYQPQRNDEISVSVTAAKAEKMIRMVQAEIKACLWQVLNTVTMQYHAAKPRIGVGSTSIRELLVTR